MTQQQTRFTVIGLGGYGLVHMDAITWLENQGLGKLHGVVALPEDRKREPERTASLQERDVELYTDIEEFYKEGLEKTDVLTVPIGIHAHVPVSVRAMEAGLDVYCEKPVAGTVQEVDELIRAEQRTGRKITIGFQHLYSHSMNQLKQRICDGRLGTVESLDLLCGWPRSKQYYTRNSWAGKLSYHGRWILDTPANNANAHYLMNLLYLASDQPGSAISPESVRAELYRANHIESADTLQMRLSLPSGAVGNVLLTHANRRATGPFMHLRCAHGHVVWQTDNGKTFIHYDSGEIEQFDNLVDENWRYLGFLDLVEAIREDRKPVCTPELSRHQTLTINAAHESCPGILTIPEEMISEEEDWEMFPPDTRGDFRRIQDLDEYMYIAFHERRFLSRLEIPWAEEINSREFYTNDYDHFPQSEIMNHN